MDNECAWAVEVHLLVVLCVLCAWAVEVHLLVVLCVLLPAGGALRVVK